MEKSELFFSSGNLRFPTLSNTQPLNFEFFNAIVTREQSSRNDAFRNDLEMLTLEKKIISPIGNC